MRIDAATADRITALVLFALGIAMLIGGITMDRLEIRQIHPASIPGLVPIGLGAAMALCAVLLYVSADKSKDDEDEAPGAYGDLMVSVGLCLVYGAGLVGKMPFFPATAMFLFSFSSYFLWSSGAVNSTEGMGAKVKFLLFNAVFALGFAGAITALFRYGFLVRLP